MVLDVSADNATDGARIIDTVWKCAEDFNNPSDWAFDGVALGLDVLGFVANPLGTLVGAGIGWLIEHVSFLKEPLDDLAGDPGAINVVAAAWGEVAKACAKVGNDYAQAATSQTGTWTGQSGDSYRTAASTLAEQIKALEGAANAVATGIRGTGILVAAVRGIIRDIVADVVAEFIIAAVTALATSWCSFGASIAAFTGWAVARAAATAGKIAGKVSKLLMKLAQAVRKFDNLKGVSDALAKAAVNIGRKAKGVGRAIGKNHASVKQIEDGFASANNAIRDKLTFGNDAAKNAANRVDDIMAPRGRDGFADTVKPIALGRTGASEAFKEGANWDESYEKGQEELSQKK
ncbi:hypothetical protein SAMN04488564_11864 [Lentzea waywayandensis]|uniref:Outer membrane channel protein CpnT-like N-terminal domain-containing protein n=1 Tax=Lentzea waywayandensis TaxID=84724 RepID=A0A1I6FH30_9PSEU|nr:hypothetical protein [Lentzea waywayandensis]SFR29266.1 hypothetical protein SAMN04488564_11864 [Lentzea waywayandensis]